MPLELNSVLTPFLLLKFGKFICKDVTSKITKTFRI